MPLLSSILPSTSPGRNPPAQYSPVHRTVEFDQEENTAAGLWRPPASVSAKSANGPRNPTGRSTSSELASLARHEADLQQHLQGLLDAQAAGLLAGAGNEADSERSETDSVTSSSSTRQQELWSSTYRDQDAPVGVTASSIRSMHDGSSISGLRTNRSNMGGVIPIRQPRPQTLSLRAARREIRQTMLSLSTTKRQERKLLQQGISGKDDAINRIADWQTKRDNLQKEMGRIQKTPDGERSQELKQENAQLTEQINALEIQLAELKSQQRAAVHELSTLENSVQAKLSSYQGSLAILDRDIKAFLKQPPPDAGPLPPSRPSSRRSKESEEAQSSVWELPPSRRTLEMVLDQMERDKAELSARQVSTDDEIAALRDGARVWDSTIRQVMSFEKELHQQLQNQPAPDSSGQTKDAASRIVRHLESVIEQVEESYQTAEQNGWNLLICCIGAELEALRQGHEILASTTDKSAVHLQSSTATIQPFASEIRDRDASAESGPENNLVDDDEQGGGDDGGGGMNSGNNHEGRLGYRSLSGTGSPRKKFLSSAGKPASSARFMMKEDDEPDPDLLVSATHDEF